MALFRSNYTPNDVYEELKNAVDHHQHFKDAGDDNLANMWKDEIDSIIEFCEINAKKLGID